MRLRAGTAEDATRICALLCAGDLPTSDLAGAAPRFVVACDGDEIVVGVGALQPFGEAALLRSVIVAPELRGTGLGRRIVQELERFARANPVKQLALLTLTAREFFERQGYQVIPREQLPEPVKGSEEFRSLCPASAICMTKSLTAS